MRENNLELMMLQCFPDEKASPPTFKNWLTDKNRKKIILRDYEEFSKYEPRVLLTDEYEKISTVEGLKTKLYPHQKTVVKGMIDLENNRKIVSNSLFSCSSSAGVLSEPVGSGKTIELLSLILKQKRPKVVPDIAFFNINNSCNDYPWVTSFASTVRRRFRNILSPTLIFVGSSVLSQWKNTIKKYTDLKTFVVSNVKELDKLISKMQTKDINQFDIVLVKNGGVTRNVKLPDNIILENKNKNVKKPYIYNIIANMRTFCWARVIVDDFDTIQLPHNAGIINGLFTWYVSSTRKKLVQKCIYNTQFKKTSDILLYSNYGCSGIMNNSLLFSNYNLRNTNLFIKKSSFMYTPIFYSYVFNNPNDRMIGLIGAIDNQRSNIIMEMLNGDAVSTAAEQVGIKTNSVADIFQKILGDHFRMYEESKRIINFINSNQDSSNREPYSQNPDQTDTYNKTDLSNLREIKYNYPGLKSLMSETLIEYKQKHESSGIAIDRVKSNIKQGFCPICYESFADSDDDASILKCCGIIICSTCLVDALGFKKSRSLRGSCPACRRPITIEDLIYMDNEFNLENLLKDDKIDLENMDIDLKTQAPVKRPKIRTKIDAILDIVKGNTPIEQKQIDMTVSHIMKGTQISSSNRDVIKALIFANYDESLNQVCKKLTENKIKFWHLKGTYKDIHKAAEKFNKTNQNAVLIINSAKHCSGLNLQTATDLIFIHQIIDKNVESQVIGRAQRIGRINSCRIHYTLYENEYAQMQNEKP